MTLLTLDHVLIAVRDLDTARDSYARLLGRGPSWRGNHPRYGTANVLFRIDNTYIELLAPGADAGESPWLHALLQHLDARGEGLYALALGTDDLDATVASAREHGLDVQDPADGGGVDAVTGAKRAWRNARIQPASTRGVPAFFIEHRSPIDALPVAPPQGEAAVQAVDHTVIGSSDLRASLAIWQGVLGLDLRATVDGQGGRRLHLLRAGGTDGKGSIVELAGQAEPAEPGPADRLWGIAYRVASVAAAVGRLRAAGVEVSDPRPGNAPDTVVADLKPGYSHDVRTLFIEKDVR